MHQAVDDIGAFPLGRAEGGGIPQQVTFVAEGVGGHALLLAEIFERVVGIQGVVGFLQWRLCSARQRSSAAIFWYAPDNVDVTIPEASLRSKAISYQLKRRSRHSRR